MEKLKVIGERVLVKMHQVQKEEMTSTGLIIETDNTEAKTHVEGTVVRVGQGDLEVEVGDTVIYGPKAGVDFEHEGVIYTLLAPRHMLAVYTKPKDTEGSNKSVELAGLDPEFIKKINLSS